MEFSIFTEELSKGLYRAQGIVEKRTAMPILSNVLFEARDGKLQISATDLEIGMTGIHPAEVLTSGAITMSAKYLYDIVRSLPKGQITIKKLPNNWAEVRCSEGGRSIEYKMLGMSPDDFHALPDFSQISCQKVDFSTFRLMIEKTIYAISSDETRYNLNGAFLEPIEGGRYRMVATDGHRLSMFDGALCAGPIPAFDRGVIIPKKGLLEVRRLLESEVDEAEFGIQGTNLVFRTNAFTVIMRLLDGQFPDYRQVLPSDQQITLRFHRKQLIESLRRISILSSDRTLGIRIELGKGRMSITTQNPDLGEAREDLPIEYEGANLVIGFNARYLIDALSNIDSELVQISLDDDISPAVVKPTDDDRLTCVVMPMRI